LLNLFCDKSEFPIPHIDLLLERIGKSNPKYFAVMDFVSVFYQCELDEASRSATAFMTHRGLYEWVRVPMGIKGAPTYFQEVMEDVLAGLTRSICELYIDDCIVFGRTEEEYLQRLEQVFQRFEDRNVTINPDKTKLGLSEIEYVGHLITQEGVTFTEAKLNKAIDFPKPTIASELKQFIGLVNYFNHHLRNLQQLLKPLNAMIPGYKKGSKVKLIWTPETEECYQQVMNLLRECPLLYFLDDHSPIHLYTDASNRGFGAYLCQVVDGKERPIAFLSKAITTTQTNWFTNEKEAYAIYWAFCQLKHILEHRKFTLHTDHRNLVYIVEDNSQKVANWKQLISQFNFDIEYIKGELNDVADSLSRLCTIYNKPIEPENHHIPSHVYKLISMQHNSTVGHMGVEKTYERVKQYMQHNNVTFERGMEQHVRNFVSRCPICQKNSDRDDKINIKPFTSITLKPMQRLSIDTIGPLPVDSKGHKYIIVMIDTFTRYLLTYPARTLEAKECAEILSQHICRYGVPDEILTDNGKQFVNSHLQTLLSVFKIEHITITPYSHEENGIVERVNKEINRHLRNIIFNVKILIEWSTYLPLAERIINSTIHSELGYSPAMLIFINSIDLNKHFLYPGEKNLIDTNQSIVNISTWAKEMLNKQYELLEAAKLSLKMIMKF